MPVRIGNLTLHMGPDDLGAADDLLFAVEEFVDAARETLDVAVQELESEPITRALIRAKQRGVKVRVVLEGDYLISDPPRTNPFRASTRAPKEPNREMQNALLRAGIEVRTDINPKIFHQKFIVRDVDGALRAVLTGSTNFTPTGTHKNLNHIVTARHAYLARDYRKEFDEIWDGTFGSTRARHDPSPRNCRISGVRVRALFAPDHGPEMEIMKQMLKAEERIDFAIFTFAQSSGIDDTMIALAKANIKVRGVMDASQGGQEWAATLPVARAGAEIYRASKKQGLGKLHHKLMVIDGEVVIAGSFNYTGPANKLNDENILVIGDLEERRADGRANQAKLGRHALTEIDRIIEKHGRRVRPRA